MPSDGSGRRIGCANSPCPQPDCWGCVPAARTASGVILVTFDPDGEPLGLGDKTGSMPPSQALRHAVHSYVAVDALLTHEAAKAGGIALSRQLASSKESGSYADVYEEAAIVLRAALNSLGVGA